MKLINLKFRGIEDLEESLDFENKSQGLILVEGKDETRVRTALSFAFYGDEDAANFFLPLVVELRVVIAYDEYYIYRKLTRLPDGSPNEEVRLTNFKGDPVCPQTKEDIDAFLVDKIGFTKRAFNMMFIIDREGISKLLKDQESREMYVAHGLNSVANSCKIIEKQEMLVAKEAKLLKELDKLEVVSKGDLDELTTLVEENRGTVEGIRNRMSQITSELQFASKYKGEMDLLSEAQANLDKLLAKKEEMEELAASLQKSRDAKAVSNVFTVYGEILTQIDSQDAEYNDLKAKVDALDEKIKKGDKSYIALGDKYASLVTVGEELEKVLRNLIEEGKNNPQEVGIEDLLVNYYKEYDQKAGEIIAESNKISEEFANLVAQNDMLVQKKKSIRDSSAYKQAVQEGAVTEGRMKIVEDNINAAKDRKEALLADKAMMVANIANIDKKMEGREEILLNLDASIRGQYKTLQESVNADVFYKQRIYSKHLLVSRNEVELEAVNQKIEEIKEANEGYKQKLELLKDRKTAIIKHRARLQEKHLLLQEKMLEYLSENRLKDVSEKVEYGSHCPICDGFVTVKKQLPLKDTKALNNQLVAVGKEIDKDEDALLEAEAAIGQYDAAVSMGAKYLVALVETRDSKKEFISNILKEYKVNTIEELFNKAKMAIERSKVLQQKVDEFKDLEKDFQTQMEARRILVSNINIIDEEKVPFEDRLIAELSNEYATMKTNYVNYKKFYREESAMDLLRKVQVIDKEYEFLEGEFETRHARLMEIFALRDTLAQDAGVQANRGTDLVIDGKSYTRDQMTVKVFSSFMAAILDEISKNQENKDKLKLKIAGVKKVLEATKAERTELYERVLVLEATINATKETSKKIYVDYEKQFATLQVKNKMDLDRMVLNDLEEEKIISKVTKYDESVAAAKEAVRVYTEGSSSNAAYFENMHQNTQELESLKKEEETALIDLGSNISKKKTLSERYDAIHRINKQLTTVQKRIKGYKDIEHTIQNGMVLADEFSKLVVERADSLVRTISGGRYKLEVTKEGAIALYFIDKGKLRVDNLTREEKMLLPLGIISAYYETLESLIGGEMIALIKILVTECDKSSLSPMYEFSKIRDLLVSAEDENAFLRAISKFG